MSFHRRKRRAGGNLGRAIRNIRRRLDLNQRELAAFLHWHQTTIAQYELGTAQPSAGRLIRLLHLAVAEEECQPILAALEAKGISVSDLSIAASKPLPMASVSGTGAQGAMSEVAISLDTAPETRASEHANQVGNSGPE